MDEQAKAWDGDAVRTWLESRIGAAQNEQARADRQGRASEDDYDKAAAEEWVCRAAAKGHATDDQQRFAAMLKELLDRDEIGCAGVHDDRRFEREARSCVRKLMKMTKANTGFGNTSRYQ